MSWVILPLGGRTKAACRSRLRDGSTAAAVKRANVKCQNGGLTFGGRSASFFLSILTVTALARLFRKKRKKREKRKIRKAQRGGAVRRRIPIAFRVGQLPTTNCRLLRSLRAGRLQTNTLSSAFKLLRQTSSRSARESARTGTFRT